MTELNGRLQVYKDLLIKQANDSKSLTEDENIRLEQSEHLINTSLSRLAFIKNKLMWSINHTYRITLKRFKKWFKHYYCPSCERDFIKPLANRKCPYCKTIDAQLCECMEESK